MIVRFPSTRFVENFPRVSPCSREEDKGEGFERARLASIVTLPLSFKREATHLRSAVQMF
jgi:hypothetical protein